MSHTKVNDMANINPDDTTEPIESVQSSEVPQGNQDGADLHSLTSPTVVTSQVANLSADISLNDLRATLMKFKLEHPVRVDKLKMSPLAFKRFNDWHDEELAEQVKQGILEPEQIQPSALELLYGLPVEVDPDLEPGECQFEGEVSGIDLAKFSEGLK